MTIGQQRWKMRTLEKGLAEFEQVLPLAHAGVRELLVSIRDSVIRTKTELDRIHVSALPPSSVIRPICFDCGSKDLDVVYTSKRDRCQLCAPCFHRRESRGAARAEKRASQSSIYLAAQPE